MVRLTDRPDMTLDVYRGRKTTTQQRQQQNPSKGIDRSVQTDPIKQSGQDLHCLPHQLHLLEAMPHRCLVERWTPLLYAVHKI